MEDNVDVCSICHSEASLPTRLPCSHEFCFLCIKEEVFHRNPGAQDKIPCPLCREPFTKNVILKPRQLNTQAVYPHNICIETADNNNGLDGEHVTGAPMEAYFWIYSDKRSNWWRYEPNMERVIEAEFQKKSGLVDFQIFNVQYLLIFLFGTYIQYPIGRPSNCREMRRVKSNDAVMRHIRGIAGAPVI